MASHFPGKTVNKIFKATVLIGAFGIATHAFAAKSGGTLSSSQGERAKYGVFSRMGLEVGNKASGVKSADYRSAQKTLAAKDKAKARAGGMGGPQVFGAPGSFEYAGIGNGLISITMAGDTFDIKVPDGSKFLLDRHFDRTTFQVHYVNLENGDARAYVVFSKAIMSISISKEGEAHINSAEARGEKIDLATVATSQGGAIGAICGKKFFISIADDISYCLKASQFGGYFKKRLLGGEEKFVKPVLQGRTGLDFLLSAKNLKMAITITPPDRQVEEEY